MLHGTKYAMKSFSMFSGGPIQGLGSVFFCFFFDIVLFIFVFFDFSIWAYFGFVFFICCFFCFLIFLLTEGDVGELPLLTLKPGGSMILLMEEILHHLGWC